MLPREFSIQFIQFSIGIVDWTKSELQELDRNTRQKLNLSGSHRPQADVNRLHNPQKVGRRGLQSTEESINKEIIALRTHFLQDKILKGQKIGNEGDKKLDLKGLSASYSMHILKKGVADHAQM